MVCIFEYLTKEGVTLKILNKKEKASTTLEAVIIMPTILIMIFAVFFAFQLLYQQVVLEYAASCGASRGSIMWDYKDYDFSKGTVGDKRGVYDSLTTAFHGNVKVSTKGSHGSGEIAERLNKVRTETENIVKEKTLTSADAVNVEVEYKSSLTGATITVTASQSVNIPFKALFTYFSGSDMELKASSVGSIFDPDEYIRNIDYGVEIGKTIVNKINNSGAISKIKSKFSSK